MDICIADNLVKVMYIRWKFDKHMEPLWTYRTKLFERYFSIFIFVSKANSFIYNLLQLRIFKIISDHHFENLKKFSVWNETIIVHIVDTERN